MDSAAGAPLEEIRSQAQKEVETNYLIMTGMDKCYEFHTFCVSIIRKKHRSLTIMP